jgi:triosephosphate isomerase (TIM)
MKKRPKFIIGNWKMNKTIAETRSFISGLALVMHQSHFQVGLAVPFTSIAAAAEAAAQTPIKIGAQNISNHDHGAYTGEISCGMIKDAGATFCLAGHSERRHLFHENDSLVNKKIEKMLEYAIKPVFCIGETLEEHQSGKTKDVLQRQILQGLKGVGQSQLEFTVIAYEPVWAIGTGKAATPDMAQETHAFCRSVLAKEWGEKAATQVILQYGGSVNPSNAVELLSQTDIDGLLVGGAALTLDSFSKIVLAKI